MTPNLLVLFLTLLLLPLLFLMGRKATGSSPTTKATGGGPKGGDGEGDAGGTQGGPGKP